MKLAERTQHYDTRAEDLFIRESGGLAFKRSIS
jgi:hypothetical protein